MPRKGLDISEALALFEELPSETDSIVSNESSDTEVYSLSGRIGSDSKEASIPDDETDSDDMNIPGPSHSSAIRWKKRGLLRKTIPDFDSEVGPSDEIINMDDQSPIAIFLALFSVQFMETIVFQSNLYATQSGKNYTPLTLQELILFFAINLTMGIKKLPSYRDYWSTSEILHDNFVSGLMPVKRFTWILGNLHLNDNSLIKSRDDKDFDKLHKLRPLLTHLSERFLSVLQPSKHQAVDESMVKFKGRSSLKQYMPKKPIKRGYKIWMRCNENGFASQFQIYTGKTKDVERNLGERVVRDLTQSICGKNHILYMDNYFSSYNLFKYLEVQKIVSCGTVNMSRRNLPKLADDKNLVRGDFDWAVSNDDITCIKWKDKRCVSVLSCLADSTDTVVIKRKERDGKILDVKCPKAVCDYNKNMDFVDHFDHLESI